MTTHEDGGWIVEGGPATRAVRMPRARIHVDPTSDAAAFLPFHSQQPVQITSGSATVSVSLTVQANWPDQALEVFAGAAFDALGAASGAIQKVLSNVALEKQLNSLSADFFEDFGTALDQASIAGLRHFLLVHQGVVPPKAISADSRGRIEATWDSTLGQSASLKFLDDEKFHYALVLETPEGRKRPWGTAGRFEVFVARPEARAILGESPTPPVSTP